MTRPFSTLFASADRTYVPDLSLPLAPHDGMEGSVRQTRQQFDIQNHEPIFVLLTEVFDDEGRVVLRHYHTQLHGQHRANIAAEAMESEIGSVSFSRGRSHINRYARINPVPMKLDPIILLHGATRDAVRTDYTNPFAPDRVVTVTARPSESSAGGDADVRVEEEATAPFIVGSSGSVSDERRAE